MRLASKMCCEKIFLSFFSTPMTLEIFCRFCNMRFPCDILVDIDPQKVKLGYLFNCIPIYFKIKPWYNFECLKNYFPKIFNSRG